VRSSISSSRASAGFLRQVALGTIAIFVAYNALIALARPQLTPSSDAGIRNRVVAERYFDGSVPRAAMVGSSLAFRLAPDFLESDELGGDIYNLAFGGGSAATGLELVLLRNTVPEIVFVEMNIGYRGSDAALLEEVVAEPRQTMRRWLPAFRLENRPVDLVVASVANGLRDLHRSSEGADEPDPTDFANRLAATLADLAAVSDAQKSAVELGYGRLQELIDRLRERNVRVVLMQLPADPAVQHSSMGAYTEAQARTRFPQDRYEWWAIPEQGAYRTDDGQHLTRASGRRLARALRNFVGEQPR
jgi:hypothetical protein